MTAREHPCEAQALETSTEWGVRWDGGFYAPQPNPFPGTEAGMREFAAGIPAAENPVVLCREVIRTAWHRPDGGWKDAGGPDV